jgi:TPP-dependent pyruvate/acetoin dehydrogenase alpha subunit
MTTEQLIESSSRPDVPLPPAVRLELYTNMVLGRAFETEAERQYKAARIGGYCHLSSGQEATCVGAVYALEADDLLVIGYRCHGFALARGVSPSRSWPSCSVAAAGVRPAAAGRCTCSTSRAVSTAGRESWRASFRWRPVSRWDSCANIGRRRCSASWATGP